MKQKYKIILSALLIASLSLTTLSGCSSNNNDAGSSDSASSSSQTSSAASSSEASASSSAKTEGTGFSYSTSIDDTGYWTGVKATDHVELFDYKAIEIPSDIHTISDEDLQAQVDSVVSSYTEVKVVTDRAIADGDTVNIDYVGSVDGVAFDGGSTQEAGTDVTIGVTEYIDDFLQQLIGHTPGETMDINVTFPDDYHEESLQGKDAVFVTKINHISENVEPELTDAFVAEKMSETNGWTTVAEMKDGLRKELQETAIYTYIQSDILPNIEIKDLPESMTNYFKASATDYYQQYADSAGMTLEDFIKEQVGYDSLDALHAENEADYVKQTTIGLCLQAIAEDAKITVTEDDLKAYFKEAVGTEDYSLYEETYGKPYLMQITLEDKVMKLMVENAVLL